jgi:pimeloyl-ACP methyl ester carboxylesterase
MVQIEPLGFGRSDRPDPYPPVDIHEQILAVCNQEDISDFAVWGFSQGGAMACTTAQATPRARLLVCGGFNVLRGLSNAWLARMNCERRIPVGSRTFWNSFHSYDWHAELRQIAVPKLMYWGTADAQRVSLKDQYILRDLGVEFVEFAGLNHGDCSLGDPTSPATDVVADWLQRNGW